MPLFVTNRSSGMEITGPPTTVEMGGFGSNGGESAAVPPPSGARTKQAVNLIRSKGFLVAKLIYAWREIGVLSSIKSNIKTRRQEQCLYRLASLTSCPRTRVVLSKKLTSMVATTNNITSDFFLNVRRMLRESYHQVSSLFLLDLGGEIAAQITVTERTVVGTSGGMLTCACQLVSCEVWIQSVHYTLATLAESVSTNYYSAT